MDEVTFRRLAADTLKGQAHLAGTGPAGTRCWACRHYRPKLNGRIEGTCAKYVALTKNKPIVFSGNGTACRHFERNPQARNPNPMER